MVWRLEALRHGHTARVASSQGWLCRTRRQLFSLRKISTQNNCTDFFWGGATCFCCVRLGTCVLADAREWVRGAGRDRRPRASSVLRGLGSAARLSSSSCSGRNFSTSWQQGVLPPQALCPRSTQAVAAAWPGEVTAGSPLCQSHRWWLRLGSRLSVHAGPRVGFSGCVLQFTVSSECIGLARPLRKVASKYLLV